VVFGGVCVLLYLGNYCHRGESVISLRAGVRLIYVKVWHTSVPVYILILASSIPTLYMLPNGFIFAMTGQGVRIHYLYELHELNCHPQIGVNILSQIIPAVILPGNPIANMVFKSYSVQTLIEGASFVQDLKLGHYVKVPPRATFVGV
jgi:hypothetical protein